MTILQTWIINDKRSIRFIEESLGRNEGKRYFWSPFYTQTDHLTGSCNNLALCFRTYEKGSTHSRMVQIPDKENGQGTEKEW